MGYGVGLRFRPQDIGLGFANPKVHARATPNFFRKLKTFDEGLSIVGGPEVFNVNPWTP